MAENNFTFWSNMKEAIDAFEGQPEFQYKLYDALTEYGLYGTWPEDDGSMETRSVIMFVQSMVPSLDKSSNYIKKCAESGATGGRNQKIADEQIEDAIAHAARVKNGVPSRAEVVAAIDELYNVKISAKTISRRCPDEKKKEIAEGTLGQNRDIRTKQGHVPMSQGQNGDTINVPVSNKRIVPFDF